jgi:hypothetical protein
MKNPEEARLNLQKQIFFEQIWRSDKNRPVQMNNAQPLLKRGFVDRVKKMKKGKEAPESGKKTS